MDNVLAFPSKKAVISEKSDPVNTFITESLMPWAMDNGVDVESMKFKLNGATIMSSLQGMLHNDI